MDALELARAAALRLHELVDQQGALELVGDELRAGGASLWGTKLVDQVKAETGFGCTIFCRYIRFATTALTPDGKKIALGTSPDARMIQSVYRRGEPFGGITHTLGNEWVIVYLPLRDHRSKIVGMVGAYREVSNFLGEIESLDSVPEGLLLHDVDGVVVNASRAACDMLAVLRSDLIGQSISDFTVSSDRDLKEAWREASGRPTHVESLWRRRDDYQFQVEIDVALARLPNSPLLLSVVRDFSEPHAARERLRAVNAQLMQSEKMAALGKLVAGVAHDVNTPLGAVQSAHQTMARAVDKLDQILAEHHPEALSESGADRPMRVLRRTIEGAGQGTDRIDKVIRRLRSFARLDQSPIQDVELSMLVDDVLGLIQHRIPEGVTVSAELGGLPKLRCYPAELNQLIMNLLVNAIDAVGTSGSISITGRATEELVELLVEDDGEGIATADLPNIFNPGFTTKGVGFGAGLGLSIAFQVAELHGGTISVESKKGEGARFLTRLPLRFADKG